MIALAGAGRPEIRRLPVARVPVSRVSGSAPGNGARTS